LQEIYKSTVSHGDWHQKHEFPNGDTVILHSPTVIMHFSVPPAKAWNATALVSDAAAAAAGNESWYDGWLLLFL